MKIEIEQKTKLLLGEIQSSKSLGADEKSDLQDILLHAEAGTNGFTQEEKIQSISETVYSLVGMLITQRLDGKGGRFAGLYKTIEACKWQITIIAGIIGTCLIFRPEVSELIKAIIK